MRKRLSWDEERMAEIKKTADPYTLNQDRQNPPVSKYQTGDPSAWAEDPHMATPWKTEGRTETGHPAPAREAVTAARKMEDKAIKCITIAQRMLPGAEDQLIEEQATDLMYLPENSVLATLQRQSDLAEVIAKSTKEDDDEDDEEKEAGKKEEEAGMKKEEKDKKAGKKEEEEEDDKEAGKKEEETPPEDKKEAGKKEEEEEDDKEAGKKEEEAGMKKEEKDKKAGKKEEEEEDDKEAGKEEEETPPEDKKEAEEENPDLLDKIFANEEIENAQQQKSGAKKLSGFVKKASTGSDPLRDIWNAPPDISAAFK